MSIHRLPLIGLLAAIGALPPLGASAGITEIRVDAFEPFADSQAFGKTGPYVRVRGVARGELDPGAAENSVIADIAKAPRNAAGRVEYETDFFMLRPQDPRRGSGILLYEVTNRGRKFLNVWIDEAPPTGAGSINDPRTAQHAGNGFSLNRGYTIVWSGWDPDAPRSDNGMTTRVPVATEDGKPIVERIREEILVGTRGPADVAMARLSYPAASTDKQEARLTVRDRESDARTQIPADGWEFVDQQSIRLLPEGSKFAPIKIYELWYRATAPKIVGIGFAATRDLVSFLRYERVDQKGTPNPALGDVAPAQGTGLNHALALGISQSGRYLRHHIGLGMNRDEQGRRVLDGVLAHISGAGKVFANHRFAMPGRTATQHEDRYYPENWFPFSAATTTDPFSSNSGSLLRRDGSDPLLIETNTSTEYWQKGASLLHVDPTGSRDLTLPANVRVYLIAGTQHGGRAGLGTAPGLCANPKNPHSAAPALRALIVALEQWAVKGIAPPQSRVPSIGDGSAVEASMLKFPAAKTFALAPGDNRIGPAADWIVTPAHISSAYETRVPAIDRDGNEVAGIRLPPIAVPLGTYTGWNVYRSQPTELCDRDGSFLAFARTKTEREEAGDPRPSLAERYPDRAAYVAQVKAAADALVRDRLLLPADAATYVKAAEQTDKF